MIRATIYHCLSGIPGYWKRTTYTIIRDQYRITQQKIQAYHKATTTSLEQWTYYWQRLKEDLMVYTAWITEQVKTYTQQLFVITRRFHTYLASDCYTTHTSHKNRAATMNIIPLNSSGKRWLLLALLHPLVCHCPNP